MNNAPIGLMQPTATFKFHLCKPDGTVLARSPSKIQALKTAEALFDDLEVREDVKTDDWLLFEDSQLKAHICKA